MFNGREVALLSRGDQESSEKVDKSSTDMNVQTGKSDVLFSSLSPVPSIPKVQAEPSSSNVMTVIDESSSDESNPADEINNLRRHKESLHQRSYASAVTQEILENLRVSFLDPSTGLGCPRP